MIDKRFCKRCLPLNTDEKSFFEELGRYLASLPAEIKTDEEEYNRRLKICSDCQQLINGVCMECGCYPHMRAAKKVMYCPKPRSGW